MEKQVIEMINSRFDRLENKVDNLCNFQWKLIGFSSAVVSVISIIGWALSHLPRS
jgi:hypothetical protein